MRAHPGLSLSLRQFGLATGAIALLLTAQSYRAEAENPKTSNIDPQSVTVSGISSGADLAHQLHIAYSATIHGAGLLAAAPYYCAKGNATTAVQYCSAIGTQLGQAYSGPPTADYVDTLVAATSAEFKNGRIDDPAGIKTAKIYLFSGTSDSKVPQPIVDSVQLYYAKLGVDPANISYVRDVPAGHGMVTATYGNECSTSKTPYINKCGVDVAGQILQQMYGPLARPGTAVADNIKAFDQSAFFVGGDGADMDTVGHAYIPTACAQGARCKLHVAVEGCEQDQDQIQDQFYTHAGYNEWAETNNVVVIYPQVKSGSGNPYACWDWWGYTDQNYHTKAGKQVAAVKRMIDRVVAGGPLPEVTNGGTPGSCLNWGWFYFICKWFK